MNCVFLWELGNASPSALAARAQAAGVRSLAVKSGDSGQLWSQYAELASPLDAAQIERPAWAYCIPSTLTADAMIAASAKAQGAPCYIADMESEYVDEPQAASLFGKLLRAKLGDAYPIYVTTFSSPLAEPQFPWSEIAAWADAIIPQIYGGAYAGGSGTQELIDAWPVLEKLGKPIYPAGALYGVSKAADVNGILAFCRSHAVPSAFWWDYDSATPALLTTVAAASVPVATSPPPQWAEALSTQVAALGVRVTGVEKAITRHEAFIGSVGGAAAEEAHGADLIHRAALAALNTKGE